MENQGYPNVDFGTVVITTTYPGATATDMVSKVTQKIEKKLKGVRGISSFRSQSVESFSTIEVRLEDRIDTNKVRSDIRSAIDQVRDLPNDLPNRPVINEINSSEFPIYEISVFGSASKDTLRKTVKNIEQSLQSLEGIQRVDLVGYQDKEVHILMNPIKAKKNYISFDDIKMSLHSHNLSLSAGTIKQNPEKQVLILQELDSITSVENIVIRSSFNGTAIRIKDVAKVISSYEDPLKYVRYNGDPSINLIVLKQGLSGAISTGDAISKLIKKLQDTAPEGVNIQPVFDFSSETRNLSGLVNSNAKIGLLLVLLALILLIHHKIAFWTAIGMPVSVLLAFLLFPLFGLTLNFITLIGIIVVLGMVVDDAIIVAENIYRYREKGLPPEEAAIKGTSEVLWPVVTTVTTTVLAFSPLMVMTGVFGKFMQELPIVIGLILFGSLFESLIILPSHIAHSQIPKAHVRKKPLFKKAEIVYFKSVNIALARPWRTIVIFFTGFIIAIGLLIYAVPFNVFPSDDGYFGIIRFETDKTYSLDQTSTLAQRIERSLKSYHPKEISSFVTSIGEKSPFLSNPGIIFRQNYVGNILIYLQPMKDRERTSTEIMKQIQEELINQFDKDFESITAEVLSDGPPVGKPVYVTIISNQDDERRFLQSKLEGLLSKEPGVFNLENNEGEGKSQLKLSFDYAAMSRLGLNPLQAANTLRTAYQGERVTSRFSHGEDIYYRLILDNPSRKNASSYQHLLINNLNNKKVPLGTLVKTEESYDFPSIQHYDGDQSVTIYSDLDISLNSSQAINKKIVDYMQPIMKKHPGSRLVFSGEEEETRKSLASLLIALPMALIGIYAVLVVLFNSYLQPLLVMLAIPFAFAGVIYAFFIHNMPLSFPALIGFLGLTGVVVNDSLVMISYLNLKRDQLGSSLKIFSQAAKNRFRPILLTTVTTAAGLFPTAYGFGGNNPVMIPLIMSIAWGLIFATVITLYLIPSMYVLLERFRNRT